MLRAALDGFSEGFYARDVASAATLLGALRQLGRRWASAVTQGNSDQNNDEIWYPLYIIGSNFIPGFTTLQISGSAGNEPVSIALINERRIRIDAEFQPGSHEVIALNGVHASEPQTFVIPAF